MGMCFGFARVGGMLSPLVAQDLPQRHLLGVTFVIMITVAGVACACTSLLSVETSGTELTQGDENPRMLVDGSRGPKQSSGFAEGFSKLPEDGDCGREF